MTARPLTIFIALLGLAYTPLLQGEDQPVRVTVSKDGKGDYKTIQKAIDESPDGTTIEIGEGEWLESLNITKPVTLIGTGWKTTRIISQPAEKNKKSNKKLNEVIEPLLKELDSETRKKVLEAYIKIQKASTALTIIDTNNIVIQNISFLNSYPQNKTGSNKSTINISDSDVQMENCAILQSPLTGIDIKGESKVKINNCFITNCWNTGIIVKVDENGSFEITNSEVRNNRYSGISIRSPSKAIQVTRCLIHGAGWHGIRYDHSAPKITQNVFHSTAVSGIYASGKTEAIVKNNLFYHSGISCWFQNRDTIESNTFIGDFQAKKKSGISQGLTVLGASEPKILKNIFVTCENAVYQGNINSKSSSSKSSDKLELVENIFWKNGNNLSTVNQKTDKPENRPIPEGNLEEEPKFVNSSKKEYQLQDDSPLLKSNKGATDFASMESNWPMQPEENIALKAVNQRLNRIARQK
jgi:Right handed beta helix region